MRVIPALLVSVAVWLTATPALPQTSTNSRPPVLSAESVLLVDTQGKVVFAKRPGDSHAPASLVKLMTLYLACEALDAGRAQWEEPVIISNRVVLTPRYRMGLRTGEAVPLRTLLEGVAIASANDAAAAVAEHLGGTEEAFVAAMNAKAEELGLTHTHYANPHGLPDPNQRSTAEDLAKLILRLLDDYPCWAGRRSSTGAGSTAGTSRSSGTRGACRRSRPASRGRPATTSRSRPGSRASSSC